MKKGNKKLIKVEVIENFYDKAEGKDRVTKDKIDVTESRKNFLLTKKVIKEIKKAEQE